MGWVFKLRNGKFPSGMECNSHTWRCTTIFTVSKQKKIKTFLANFKSFASFRLQKTQQQLSGHFPHTVGYAVALKLQCIPFVMITQEFI